mgnify:CR=1
MTSYIQGEGRKVNTGKEKSRLICYPADIPPLVQVTCHLPFNHFKATVTLEFVHYCPDPSLVQHYVKLKII